MGERAARNDPRAKCPTTGRICLGKLAILERQAENRRILRHGPAIEFPIVDDEETYMGDEEIYRRSPFIGMGPEMDSINDELRLREYDIRANRDGCANDVEGDCPTRIGMENNEFRADVLTVLRGIKRIFS
jgi:hypothetical protein